MSKLPILPMSMPSTLRGQSNGNLRSDLLRGIGVGSAKCEATAARSFMAMFAELKTLGYQIRQVGHYRSFDEQLRLFISRYEQVSLATYSVTLPGNRKKWDNATKHGYSSVYWRKVKRADGSYPATAATPGSSNHGWGLAIDIAEEYDSDPQPDPIRQVLVNWLVHNASRYGISAELQSEPWHWRYVAGDRIPSETLRYEAGGQPQPVAPIPSPGPSLQFSYPGTPLVLGSQGEAVKLIQTVVGAKPDGDFGPATDRRVKAWQATKGLKADGIVGPVTWRKMFG